MEKRRRGEEAKREKDAASRKSEKFPGKCDTTRKGERLVLGDGFLSLLHKIYAIRGK